ncbi:MAG: UvrD-helicase domain-containing protein [Acidimicrobiales bacterium]
MATLEIDGLRQQILDAEGHLLIQGGPGCGKTTIALLKAQRRIEVLRPEQRVLFLSFSRAAVRQISDRMGDVFDRRSRSHLALRTFHAFFLAVVRSHGRLLTGVPSSFLAPDREAQRRADFSGDWAAERRRMAKADGLFTFDLLAETAASLFEGSKALRALYGGMYPLVIVDEFQDTNVDQWRAIKALAEVATVICLADPDQRIFGHLPGVDEERIAHAIDHLHPVTFDLSADNYRSPEGGLLSYANAVLRGTSHVKPDNVYVFHYGQRSKTANCELRVHQAIVGLRSHLAERIGRTPTIAVLASANQLVGQISLAISETSSTSGGDLPPIEHELQWEPELAPAAGYVVGSILEWPGLPRAMAIPKTLRYVADFYRHKLDAGTQGARAKIDAVERAISTFEDGGRVRLKTARILIECFEASLTLSGDPVADWQTARRCLAGSGELTELFSHVRRLRLFRATDALARALTDAWDGVCCYLDASVTVRRVLTNEYLTASIQDTVAVSLMSMHRSKGKEFDGVIITEGQFRGRLLDFNWDADRILANRRLLRVAITRARHAVVFVRPEDAVPLVNSHPAAI